MTETHAPATLDIGLEEASRPEIADGLSRLLADTYTLYLKTQHYHWNVTGPTFASLHLLFETEYTELAAAADQIAERIRALGRLAPGSYHQFAALTKLSDDDDEPGAHEMIRRLLEGHEVLVRTARAVLPVAERGRDQPTVDLVGRRIEAHEKHAWMLRSLLEP